MQILASALPGLRDVRAPILGGYLWFLFAWLLVDPNLARPPLDSAGAALFSLAHHIGHISLVVAISTSAYLVGSASQRLAAALGRAWPALISAPSRRLRYRRELMRNERVLPPFEWMRGTKAEEDVNAPNARAIREIANHIHYVVAQRTGVDPEGERRAVLDDIDREADRARNRAAEEIALPATLLVGKEPELFAEVDRLHSEGEFRIAAGLPLFALTVLLAVISALWWLLALPLVYLIWEDGIRRVYESRFLISNATARGVLNSVAIEEFRSWATTLEKRMSSPMTDE